MKTLRVFKYIGFGILGICIRHSCDIWCPGSLELADTRFVQRTGPELLANCRIVPSVEDPAYRSCTRRAPAQAWLWIRLPQKRMEKEI